MLSPLTDRLIALALEEDLAFGDLTSEAIFTGESRSRGHLLAKEPLVLSGMEVAEAVLRRVDPRCQWRALHEDGDEVANRGHIAELSGPTISLLKAERTLLNFLQRLSGIATQSARYAKAVEGLGVRLVDTRKTTPGWRVLEKAAVRAGGCHNHRGSLGEHVLIKDNHIAAAGSIASAVSSCRERAPHGARIECEVTNLAQAAQALEAGADILLLDNMNPEQVREVVAFNRKRALLEVSGGINLSTVASYASTGVQVISVGALTHGARGVDISLEFETGS
jgi:nicotinate-nucleotide pyrophosphorylase (carboxylating)